MKMWTILNTNVISRPKRNRHKLCFFISDVFGSKHKKMSEGAFSTFRRSEQEKLFFLLRLSDWTNRSVVFTRPVFDQFLLSHEIAFVFRMVKNL